MSTSVSHEWCSFICPKRKRFPFYESCQRLEAKCKINSDAVGPVTLFRGSINSRNERPENVAAKTATAAIQRKSYGVVMVLKC
jgi:hypothetical protein